MAQSSVLEKPPVFESLPVLPGVDPKAFVQAFLAQYGRAPRILHIGNIANNAFGNAKLLNEVGFDCDVLCYDYYHIMGCPEWDDADFEGTVSDHFYPDWTQVNLKGYKRPKWFVQGPFNQCIRYLLAKRSNRRLAAWYHWHLLEWKRFEICSAWCRRANELLSQCNMRPLKKALKYFSRIFSNLGGFVAAVVMFTVYVVQLAGMLALFPLLFALSRRATQAKPLFRKLYQSKTPPPEVGDDKLAQVVEEHAGLLFELIPSSNTSLYCKNHWIRKHYAPLVEEFNYRFPDHPHRLSVDDVIFFKSRLASFHKLFEHYDIIHAYATDPIFPMLIGTKPYVAYEHGTIREIPFENTIVGKLTLLAYARANAILLTNADNLPKARFIQADHSRIVNGYHRFDERKILAQLEQIRHYSREAGRFGIAEDIKVFFAPARQDHPVKGNDKILVAAAQVNQKYPGSFKVVFAQWGRHIEKAKAMIAELGLEDVVVWVDPLGSKDLMNSYRSVDAVLDQFVLPCIGGLPIDVMVVGEAPVISYLDDDLMGEFYGQTIPLFNCHEAQDIARAMETVITRPDQAQEVIEACKQWVRHYHTHQNVVQKLVEAYQLTGVV